MNPGHEIEDAIVRAHNRIADEAHRAREAQGNRTWREVGFWLFVLIVAPVGAILALVAVAALSR